MNDESKEHLADCRFTDLALDDSLKAGIADAGFEHCTAIQAEALPLALAGKDVAGQAQTGTGKTAAFLLATLQYLLTHPAAAERRPNQVRTLILAPTRELAVQIEKDAVTLGKHTGITFGLAYGGTGYEQQRKKLEQGVDVLIGTPGRIIDYFNQSVFDLSHCQVVVLDEADRMFDLGFIKDIRYLLRRCPKPEQRLSMLFSATLSHRVRELAYEHMNNPVSVEVEPEQVTADRVREVLYHVANDEKVPLLLGILGRMDAHRTIVFVNTKRVADRVWGFLEANGFQTAVLSGDVPQKKRLRLLEGFQSGELAVLVATDVAARGLHISDVSHVINYDLPQDAEDYVHRIGRTARAGAEGDAISFACETYVYSLPEIEDYIGHKIPSAAVDNSLMATDIQPAIRPERDSRIGRKPAGKGGRRDGRRGGNKGDGRRRSRGKAASGNGPGGTGT